MLAYSTISQLAYMMFAIGIGAYAAAVFHLMTHAFFKSLLFLGAGSVNHSTNTFDMTRMGGLRGKMPITYATFVIGALSLAGVIPLAGFWSKDEILIDAWQHNQAVFAFGLLAAGLTAFYMVRAIALTFHGDYRGGEPPAPGEHGADPAHPHESSRTMTVPLVVLAVLAVGAGWLTFGGEFQSWVLGALPDAHEAEFLWHTGVFIGSTLLAAGAAGAAIAIYVGRDVDPARMRAHPARRPAAPPCSSVSTTPTCWPRISSSAASSTTASPRPPTPSTSSSSTASLTASPAGRSPSAGSPSSPRTARPRPRPPRSWPGA